MHGFGCVGHHVRESFNENILLILCIFIYPLSRIGHDNAMHRPTAFNVKCSIQSLVYSHTEKAS